jgi:tetratricopeptide (TPR) repeat protein
MECYDKAITAAKYGLTERQQGILEQSLFFSAEIYLARQQWQAAYDLYVRLRDTGTKIQVLDRMVYCKAKMGGLLDAFKDIKDEKELAFVQKRIDENPGTSEALQAEIFLIEFRQSLAQQSSRRDMTKKDATAWPELSPFVEQYEALLKKYPVDVLRQKDQGTYIKLRQAGIYLHAPADHPDVLKLTTTGFNLCERVLAEAPQASFRIEAMEKLALLAQRSGRGAKAYDTYQALIAMAEADPEVAARRPPQDYLDGLVGTVSNNDLAGGAIATMDRVIAGGKALTNGFVRQAYFNRAELNAMRGQYATAAVQFKEFVKLYGPPQDAKGFVDAKWVKPISADAGYVQVCDAAQRAGQCWLADNNQTNALASYRWAAENLNHLNSRVAEAWHMVLLTGVSVESLAPDKKEELARNLWTRIVNPSIDIGSKTFKDSYYRWIREPDAMPFVKSAILKAGQFLAERGNHKLAADIFKEYMDIYKPDGKGMKTPHTDPESGYDAQYAIASYAAGKEYLQVNERGAAVERFRVFLDHMRTSGLRIPALMAVGYYGTLTDMNEDAAAAYSALLDEYGPANPMDPSGLPVPVSKEERLRKDGNWDGVRKPLPANWDAGKMRYGLGFMHWKRGNWAACQAALAPFVEDPVLRKSEERAKSLFMLAQCLERQFLPTKAIKIMDTVIKEYPKFDELEAVYANAARLASSISEWAVVTDLCARYVVALPDGQRRAYMDLYAAVAQVGSGKTESGLATLRQLSEADTYADVKAGACYHLAMQILRDPKGDKAAAFALLKKSVDNHMEPMALLQAAKTACDVKDWKAAREYLDKFGNDFPTAERTQLDEAQLLRRRIVQESGGR